MARGINEMVLEEKLLPTKEDLENVKGSFSKWKFADFIVLDSNPYELKEVSKVVGSETWMNDELKYKLCIGW
jgi:predicted amidohydrolase YtcJ